RLSVPRLMALTCARTRTSLAPGAGSGALRISPWPGAAIQKARAAPLISEAEDALEERVGAKRQAADRRADAEARLVYRRQRDARAAGAQKQRRDRDLQAIEASLAQEIRDRDAAAFDEEPMKSARGE